MLTEALLASPPETTPAVLEQLGVRRTVYGFVYPETRALVDSLWAERPHALYAEAYRDRQDTLHLPFLEAWARWSAPAHRLDLRSPSLGAVFFSLSKAFGVYYHRIGGVLSRAPLPGLEGNRWFKNVFSLALGTLLLERFGVRELPAR